MIPLSRGGPFEASLARYASEIGGLLQLWDRAPAEATREEASRLTEFLPSSYSGRCFRAVLSRGRPHFIGIPTAMSRCFYVVLNIAFLRFYRCPISSIFSVTSLGPFLRWPVFLLFSSVAVFRPFYGASLFSLVSRGGQVFLGCYQFRPVFALFNPLVLPLF